MDTLDYNAQAELFPGLLRMQTLGYKRFDHAVDSILPAQALAGPSLEVGEDRFNAEGIRRLYEQAPARNKRLVAWRWS